MEGPVGADSVFHLALTGRYQAVLSLYHDQGHIATKTLDFERTIAITNGMPILRTSVDHGTAFDIAGRARQARSAWSRRFAWPLITLPFSKMAVRFTRSYEAGDMSGAAPLLQQHLIPRLGQKREGAIEGKINIISNQKACCSLRL